MYFLISNKSNFCNMEDKKPFNKEAYDWLGCSPGYDLQYLIWDGKYRFDNEDLSHWFIRVSGGNMKIADLIQQRKFIFGGRTLANRGITNSGSFSNCYSIGYVGDTLPEILKANTDIALTFCHHGGQGLSLSKIRPKGSLIKGKYTTDGIVPFMRMFNTTTETISQGGSRKGALMMSLSVWHPEIETFISIKSDKNEINKANLSVEIDDEFMECVKAGVTEKRCEFYYNDTVYEYTINPVAIFEKICQNARDHAEPGILFTNRLRNYNLMEKVEGYQIETTNPCGEQPLPKHGACNLCSINLSEYVLNPFTSEAKIDFESLRWDIGDIVSAMDDIVSENMMRHALPEQRMMAEKYRNIGIGIMGLADMFIKMGVRYGDDKSLEIAERVMAFITQTSIRCSNNLAHVRGSFPGYDPLMMESEFAQNVLAKPYRDIIVNNGGLRNSTFISIAPTGSVGTMFNVGTGIEPFFRLEYVRTTKSLEGKEQEHRERPRIIQEYLNHIGKEDIDIKDLPEYFVSSDMIDYRQRIKLQAVLQKYTDTGISSTINLPKGTSVETIYELYMLAWKEGLKGVTVYVDGSRDGILTENGNTPKGKRTKVHAKPRPKKIDAEYYPVRVKGENFGVIMGYLDDEPYEIFAIRPDKVYPQHFGTVTKVKKRVYKFESDKMVVDNMVDPNTVSDSEGNTSLLVSAMLRHEMPVEFIADVVRKTSDSIVSYSSSLAKILDKHAKPRVLKDKCPDCGGDLIREGGCTHCSNCEYAKCGD